MGPILFLLYINDIDSIPFTQDIVLYGDDTNVFFSSTDLASVIATANSWLQQLSLWLDANELQLNVKKTKYIIFTSKNRPTRIPCPLTFQSLPIERVQVHKFLGVIFHENLLWNHHVDFVKRKTAQSIGVLNKLRPLLPTPLKRQLYFSLVHSRLQYCLLVWGVTSKSNLNFLVSIQKRGIRFINNLPMAVDTLPYFAQNLIIGIQYMYELRLAETIYLTYENDRESFLLKYTDTHPHYSFRHTVFKKNRIRTNYGTQLLEWQIPNLLNYHPDIIGLIDCCRSLYSFKKQIKLYFMNLL